MIDANVQEMKNPGGLFKIFPDSFQYLLTANHPAV